MFFGVLGLVWVLGPILRGFRKHCRIDVQGFIGSLRAQGSGFMVIICFLVVWDVLGGFGVAKGVVHLAYRKGALIL